MNAILLRIRMKCMEIGETLKGRPRRTLRRLVRDERAVSVIEYVILLGIIVAATAVAVTQFGNEIQNAITQISNNVSGTVSTIGST